VLDEFVRDVVNNACGWSIIKKRHEISDKSI